MLELGRFFGIIIRMYLEAGGPHRPPHFHAYYQGDVAVYGFDPIELISGEVCPNANSAWWRLGRNCTSARCVKTGNASELDKPRNLLRL